MLLPCNSNANDLAVKSNIISSQNVSQITPSKKDKKEALPNSASRYLTNQYKKNGEIGKRPKFYFTIGAGFTFWSMYNMQDGFHHCCPNKLLFLNSKYTYFLFVNISHTDGVMLNLGFGYKMVDIKWFSFGVEVVLLTNIIDSNSKIYISTYNNTDIVYSLQETVIDKAIFGVNISKWVNAYIFTGPSMVYMFIKGDKLDAYPVFGGGLEIRLLNGLGIKIECTNIFLPSYINNVPQELIGNIFVFTLAASLYI